MTLIKTTLLAAAMAAVAPISGALAKPAMRDVPEIENILFAAALAYEVSGKCTSLAARRFKGLRMALRLRNRANALGYSDREIRAYVESDVEKARMRKKAETFLRANGVAYNKLETFCSFGRAEIAKSSAIGALLKAK
jgi:Family of unknown function (DUF5333)